RWQGLLASVYGGISEELLTRLFLVSVFAWLLSRVLRGAIVFWSAIVLAAVLFGLGHLPATAALLPLTPAVIARAVGLTGMSAVVAGDTIYLAGATSGRDAAGNVVGRGDIEAQTIAVFESLESTLAATHATFADLTKITVLATKLEYRAKIGEVRSRYIPQPP